MIQYPAELPLPLQDGYGYSTVDPMRSTQMVTGRRRYRRIRSFVPSTVTLNFNFSWEEAAFFDAWYARTLGDGIEWFEMPLQLQPGFMKYQVHFNGIYSRTELTQVSRWRYSFEADLRERPLIPAGWELFPDYWLKKNVIDLALNREWPAMSFDFSTYADAISAVRSLQNGILITIDKDESNDGRHSVRKVRRADSPSLSLDFVGQRYLVGVGSDSLELVRVYG